MQHFELIEKGAEMSELAIIGRASHDTYHLVGIFSMVVSDCRFARHDMFYQLRRSLRSNVTNDRSYGE
jgi:hypothetical protein